MYTRGINLEQIKTKNVFKTRTNYNKVPLLGTFSEWN